MGDGNYNLNSIDVVKWKQGSTENNCYWNIAKNQIEQKNGSASTAEIKALAEQIQKETEARNTAIANRNGVIYEGDQIFIPLEYAMDEIQANIGTITEQVTQASGTYKEATDKLTSANSKLADALSAYQSAQAAYDPEAENADNSQVTAAKQAYLEALKEQQEAAKEAQTAKQELEDAQGELESAKTEYQELVEEYDGEKESFQAELDEVNSKIEASETELNDLQQEYDAAKTQAQLDEAERSKSAAENMGVTEGDDGAFALEEDPDNEALEGAISELGHTGTEDDEEDSETTSPETGEGEEGETSQEELRSEIAAARAQTLFAAMDGAGTNDDAVKELLRNTSGQDLVDVMEAYEKEYGESLEDAIKGDFSFFSGESELIGYLNTAKNYADSTEREEVTKESLLDAKVKAFDTATVDKWGTNEEILNKMISDMSDEELAEFAEYYKTTKGKDIADVIRSETSGQQQNMLISRIESATIASLEDIAVPLKDESEMTEEELAMQEETQLRSNLASARAATLHAAMQGAGTDDGMVKEILRNASGQDLVDVMEAYEKEYGESLEDAIKGDFSFFSGESELIGYLNTAKNYADSTEREEVTKEIVANTRAMALIEATSGRIGTDEDTVYSMLMNQNLSNEEILAIQTILQTQGMDLVQMIKNDFSGSVEKALLERLKAIGIE